MKNYDGLMEDYRLCSGYHKSKKCYECWLTHNHLNWFRRMDLPHSCVNGWKETCNNEQLVYIILTSQQQDINFVNILRQEYNRRMNEHNNQVK